jgi:general secretion pathway protein B
MSFILDALRKSEHERQRQTGPALAEVAVAPPRPRTNTWATAAIVLLLVNLVAVAVLLFNRSRQENGAPLAEAGPAGAAPVTQSATTQAASDDVSPRPDLQRAPPPMLQPAREPAPVTADLHNPLEEEVSAGPPLLDPQLVADAAAAPEGPPAVSVAPSRGGSVVYESLPDTATLGAPPTDARAASTSGLPTADEIAAGGGIPALALQLHVYSNRPQDRFVFINAHKYREGDTLQEGPRVEQITAEGVLLDFRGSRFLLPRD